VVCLAIANADTENLMNAQAFARMKPGAFFVNASRGNLVDEAALREALDRGHLAGCAMDVGRAPDQMPTPELARHPKVIATPHVAGLTPQAIEHQSLETVAQDPRDRQAARPRARSTPIRRAGWFGCVKRHPGRRNGGNDPVFLSRREIAPRAAAASGGSRLIARVGAAG
jgi:hypothetical protein